MALKIYTTRVKGICETHARTNVSVGDHKILIDEPLAHAGTNLGPTPIDHLTAAFAGCTNVISSRIAQSMGIKWEQMTIDVVSDLDLEVIAQKETEVGFPTLEMTVEVSTDATEAQMTELKERLAIGCPLSVLFRQSGTKVTENWIVNPV